MKRRRRILAGSLALVAMTFSMAETVLASVCASPSGANDMADMPGMAMADEGMAGLPMPEHEGSRQAAGDNDACPLALALGPGCSSAASLPATVSRVGSAMTRGTGRAAFDGIRRDLLLTHGLFRPPRA